MVDRVTLNIDEWAEVVGTLMGSAAGLTVKARSSNCADPDKMLRTAQRLNAVADKIVSQLS